MASYLTPETVHYFSVDDSRKDESLEYDTNTGHLVWEWESEEDGYQFRYELDFQGVDISLYCEKEEEYILLASGSYAVQEQIANWTNQIIDRLNRGESTETMYRLEDIDLTKI